MSISDILDQQAQSRPDQPALVFSKGPRDITISFSELRSRAVAFAAHLSAHGVLPGDPVVVFIPMSASLYVALLGIFRLGATAVFIDPSTGWAGIRKCCRRVPPKAMVAVAAARFARHFIPELRRVRAFQPPEENQDVGCLHDPITLPALPSPEAPALITFTSGSTGEPKAAVRTHGFLIAQHEALRTSIRLVAGERDLTTLPVFVLANLASGVTSILPDARISHPGSIDAPRLARQILRLRPTRTGGSPACYLRLAQVPEALAGFRSIYTGGAPVFPSTLKRIRGAAPAADIIVVYGSTEAEPISHISIRDVSDADWASMRSGAGLLVGPPIPGVRLRICHDQSGTPLDNPEALPTGSSGEILVAGDHVLKGYLAGIGDSETKVSIDGEIWHRTGDAGTFDHDGRLWLLGRCTARITDARGTIYPFAAECAATEFPFVRRAALVRLKSHRALVVEPPPTPDQSASLLSALRWAHIEEVLPLKLIPVDARHNAKVNYPKLKKMLAKRRR